MFNGKKALDYSLIMLFIVLVTLPVLYMRLTTKVDETKQTIGEIQSAIITAPYDKEETINYIQKSAETEMTNIIATARQKLATEGCNKNPRDIFTEQFNDNLNKYLTSYNQRAYLQLPLNNYETYIEGNNVHAIALQPIKKNLALTGKELQPIGAIWFAPSFTITITSPTFQTLKTEMQQKTQSCQNQQTST